MAKSISVLVADDHRVVRDGLRAYLSAEDGIEVVGEAGDAAEAFEQARSLHPDVVIMDLAMPGGGIAATARISQDLPASRVVVLTSATDDHAVVDALQAGAAGFVLKESGGAELAAAVRAAAEGRVHLSPEVAARLARSMAHPLVPEPLTPREHEVLTLVAGGLGNKQIARRLGISDKTVKGHVTNVLQKLGVQTRTQAALHAVRAGLLDQ